MTVGDVSGETSAPVGRYGADGRGGGVRGGGGHSPVLNVALRQVGQVGGGGPGGAAGALKASHSLDHRKSTLARGSRWDYTPLPF